MSAKRSTPRLSNLHPDLHMQIMSHLPTRNVAGLRGVSRSLRNTANVVARERLNAGVAAVVRARKAAADKVALFVLSNMRTLLNKLKRQNWRFPEDWGVATFVGDVGVDVRTPFRPLGPGYTLHIALAHWEDDASKYYMVIQYEYRNNQKRKHYFKFGARLEFRFKGDDLQVHDVVWYAEEEWYFQALRQAFEWYSQSPIRR